MKTFYTTWVEGTSGGYGYPHETFEKAKEEAERLASLPMNMGKRVRVLQCLGFAVVKNTYYEPCETEGLPVVL